MTAAEKESILTLALMAAFADGAKNDAERAELKRIAAILPAAEVQSSALYQRVLLQQVTVPQAVAPIESRQLRQLAYELAVCVCDADGAQTEAEKRFLTETRRALNLDEKVAAAFEQVAEALASEPLSDLAPVPAVIGPAATTTVDAEVDRMVLNYAILNGALELLPESLATMAIVPLQMKMVYRVGKHYGHELGRGHIKELLAAAGVGLTSQVLEGYARKLLGGLLGKAGGGIVKGVGKQVASSAMTFATTWALGQLARQYYAGGRRLSAIELRQLFSLLTEQGRALHSRYAGDIQLKAGKVNVSQLLPSFEGGNERSAAREERKEYRTMPPSMIVADTTFDRVTIRHGGITPDELAEASFRILDQVPGGGAKRTRIGANCHGRFRFYAPPPRCPSFRVKTKGLFSFTMSRRRTRR